MTSFTAAETNIDTDLFKEQSPNGTSSCQSTLWKSHFNNEASHQYGITCRDDNSAITNNTDSIAHNSFKGKKVNIKKPGRSFSPAFNKTQKYTFDSNTSNFNPQKILSTTGILAQPCFSLGFNCTKQNFQYRKEETMT